MFQSQKKIDLAPRLKLGVGRGYPRNKLLKIGAYICLLLALGLTANAIRLLFFGNSDQPKASQEQVLGASDSKDNLPQLSDYKVQKGDTLFSISQKYGIDWTL